MPHQQKNSKSSDDCPRCGGRWYEDLDEENRPYTCYTCCNGTIKTFEEDNDKNNNTMVNRGASDIQTDVLAET
jgi:hypothetical protein